MFFSFQSIVLNLAISESFQTVDLSTMTFPAELHVDYVRVYQREGEEDVGCSPDGYPTENYIEEHLEAYSSELCFVPCPFYEG